jgi:hypothetical protein
MADRLFEPEKGNIGRQRVRLNFTFNTNGSSDPNTTFTVGAADLVNRINIVATGINKVILSNRDKYWYCLNAEANLEDTATGAGNWAQAGSVQSEYTSNAITFNVYTYNGTGSLTNVTNGRIFVELVFRNTASIGAGDP